MSAVNIDSANSEAIDFIPVSTGELVNKELRRLALGDHTYMAAYPGYTSRFTRDGLVAAFLGGDKDALKAQLIDSFNHQAKLPDPLTGAEEGKLYHELPAVYVKERGQSTAYAACDTTALGLIATAALSETGDKDILEKMQPNIKKSVDYIMRHVNINGIFYEDPSFAEADSFALKVTYWKDSVLNDADRQEPVYPVIYSLAHFQNASAIGRIATLIGDKDLVNVADKMMDNGIEQLWRGDHFVTAIDAGGDIDPLSSDSLHALHYIPADKMPYGYGDKIEQYMKQLETPYGYRAGIPAQQNIDPYHMYVWPNDNAYMNSAANTHALKEAKEITKRAAEYIPVEMGLFPELISPETGEKAGNDWQLWALRAWQYFKAPDKAIF